jgi:succinate dehydrogenase / fumarate reductase, cytochrome b subunit
MRTAPPLTRRPANIVKWFDPRHREVGTLAFILNRVTALGLTFYLFLHLIALSQLSGGPQAYDNFIKLVKHPVFIFGELMVVAAGLIHGLNGIRIILTSFGIGIPWQKQILFGLMAVALLGTLFFAVRMFGGE